MEEYEIKFLEVDVPALEKKLLGIGAEKVGEFQYKRAIFDYPDWRLDKDHSWIRLRTDDTETTLTYKKRLGTKSSDGQSSDEGMQEIEIVVSDYQKMFDFFTAIGFVVKREQENKRVRYQKGKAVFDIDFWPQIPPYIEVEADSLEAAQAAARELGFDPEKGFIFSPKQVYRRYGFEENDYSSMTFAGFVKK